MLALKRILYDSVAATNFWVAVKTLYFVKVHYTINFILHVTEKKLRVNDQ